MFCSFDAEEYGLLGSTEWTEVRARDTYHQAFETSSRKKRKEHKKCQIDVVLKIEL